MSFEMESIEKSRERWEKLLNFEVVRGTTLALMRFIATLECEVFL